MRGAGAPGLAGATRAIGGHTPAVLVSAYAHMAAIPRPEPGSLQMAVITAVVSAFVFGCLSIGGGCLDVLNAAWAFLGENQTVVSAGLSQF